MEYKRPCTGLLPTRRALVVPRRCPNCTAAVFERILDDVTFEGKLRTKLLGVLLLDPVAALIVYRLAHALYFAPAGRLLSVILMRTTAAIFGCDIHPRACLGPRSAFAHTVGIVIGRGIVAEGALVVYANVVLGGGRAGSWPTIDHGVAIYSGACVVGPAHLRTGAQVGANTYVDFDVAPGALVVNERSVVKSKTARSQ